ncbi:MBL fold metallo-hydrolase [Dictyobacter kobayashii]|uniref:MBL fold metallo-hydrolase n=1 Tax=Dictyobacter kobayashii TaxID=2014872 RepID=A0A402AR35_9CHLR|nr:MBL fold metallo-hydrolase [Dictyobacter kobayashii]GCE21552.1 MBL fold metallo-hydrolase [Dictyobacter kobayashii]
MVFSGALFESPYFQIERVADGVYAAIVRGGKGAWGNAGIVDLGGVTLLFDTFFTPRAAQSLREAAEALTGRPPTYVINSHFHADHVFGNQVFDDATIVATNRTYELMSVELPATLEEARADPASLNVALEGIHDPRVRRDRETLAGDYQALEAELAAIQVRLPDITFEQSMVFHGTKCAAQLITFGGGHTPSDVILYLPALATAFTADIVQVDFHPSMNTGNLEEWLRMLDQVEALQLEHVIPGHGNVGTGEHVKIMRQYLLDLRQLVEQARQDSTTSDYLSTIKEPEKYTTWSASGVFAQNLRNVDRWYHQ